VLSFPSFTEQELQECTTLIYHSSSQISSTNSKDANRNHNIAKAIKFYKGLVVMPGDFISYNELLGERTQKAGWLEANTIAQDKSYKKALGGGICQAATTIFNAAFRAGATITESHPHSFRAYKSFGLAMDAMINWASGDDMAFKNDTKYPIFFNTYFWYSPRSGLPKYVDVDVYTMPQKDEQGNILHIMPDSQEIENQPPAQPPEYIEDTENQFADKKWSYDAKLNKEIYKHVKTSNLFKYNVDKVWYKDCVEQKMGVWTGGTEVKREHSHTYTYKSVRGKIYTRSVAPAAPQQPATATGGASG
jgi:hypothetical protein